MSIKDIPNLSDLQISKFFSKRKLQKDCWIWYGQKTKSGYGVVSLYGVNYRAHRVSLFLHNKKNNKNLALHSCNNPSCINPKHLRYGTPKDNSLDLLKSGNNAKLKKTHCPSGHLLGGDNLRIVSPGHRRCRACDRVTREKSRKKIRNLKKIGKQNNEL